MLNLNQFFNLLEKHAPLEISKKYIESGDYDNSGILVRSRDSVNKVLFSLDLSESAIKRAKYLGIDTIVTHHPAIYNPLKSLSVLDVNTNKIMSAVKMGLNVISMHLNLDAVDGGIDDCLRQALKGEKYKVLYPITDNAGYGREFSLSSITFSDFIKSAKKALSTNKVIAYGNKNAVLKTGASFCGGGASHAIKYILSGGKADVIITSDMPHHVILETVESGKCVMLLTHYSAENYGFNKYFEKIKKETEEKVECYFYSDKIFM